MSMLRNINQLRTASKWSIRQQHLGFGGSVASNIQQRKLSLHFRVAEGSNRNNRKLLVKDAKSAAGYVDLDAYIGQHRDQLSKQDVVAMCLESSKRKVRIIRLADITAAFQSNQHMYDANALSVLACGLQLYSSVDQPARLLLTAICDRLENNSPPSDYNASGTSQRQALKWSPVECSNVLYGLQGMNSTQPEVQRLLHLLPQHSRPFTPHTRVTDKMISKGLYGLQKMSSDDACTRNILMFCRRLVASCQGDLGEQALSSSLFGLQGCHSDHAEVTAVLKELIALLPRNDDDIEAAGMTLQPPSVGAALFGMQRMSNSHPVVEKMLARVTDMAIRGMNASSEGEASGLKRYEGYTIGSVFLGLQQMHAHSSAMRRLLTLLRKQLELCDPASLNELALVNMFYGLQNMSSEEHEVRLLLRVLTEKLAQWTKLPPPASPSSALSSATSRQLSLRGISSCLFGLKEMSDAHTEVTRGAMWILREQLVRLAAHSRQHRSSADTTKHKQKVPSVDVDMYSKEVTLASGVFRNMQSGNVDVRRMLQTQAAAWTALATLAAGDVSVASQKKHNKEQKRSGNSSAHQASRTPSAMCLQWDTQAVGTVLYNLRNMSNECEEVRSFLRVVWEQGLQHRATAVDQGVGRVFPPLMLSHSLYGLRSMTSEHDGMTASDTLGRVLHSLTDELEQHYLSLMSAKGESRERSSHGTSAGVGVGADLMSAQHMCVALYGLQGCSDRHAIVTRLVGVSANILHHWADTDCNKDCASSTLDIVSLANCVFGLQSMSNRSAEVRHLLGAVSRHLALCDLSLNKEKQALAVGTATGHVLYGLQAMSLSLTPLDTSEKMSGNEELSSLLSLVHSQLVLPFSSHFAIDSIQRALYGIASLLRSGTSFFPASLCASSACLSSLSSPSAPPLLNIVELMLDRVASILSVGLNPSLPDTLHSDCLHANPLDLYRDIIPLYQTLSLLQLALPPLRSLKHNQHQNENLTDDEFSSPQLLDILSTLERLLVHLKPSLPQSDGNFTSSSKTEKIFVERLEGYIQQNNKQKEMSVHLNEMINGFSTDILIRGHHNATNSSQIFANIEIDGPSHQFPRKKRFMELRDELLEKTQGVTVTRVDVDGQGYVGSKLEGTLAALLSEVDRQHAAWDPPSARKL